MNSVQADELSADEMNPAGDWRELASPPLKLVPGTKDQTSPMKRKDVLDQKIQFLEDNADKLKHLKETPDTKEMLDASKALYDLVMPVYKKEYQQLARLFDEGAPRAHIDTSPHRALPDRLVFRVLA
jgi:hypothetical protein